MLLSDRLSHHLQKASWRLGSLMYNVYENQEQNRHQDSALGDPACDLGCCWPFSLLPSPGKFDKFKIMFFPLVNTRSEIDRTLSVLYLVGSKTCWKRKQSLIHSINLVEVWVSIASEVISTQLMSFMLKSPTISKWLGFRLQIFFIRLKNFSVFSSVLFGLR